MQDIKKLEIFLRTKTIYTDNVHSIWRNARRLPDIRTRKVSGKFIDLKIPFPEGKPEV